MIVGHEQNNERNTQNKMIIKGGLTDLIGPLDLRYSSRSCKIWEKAASVRPLKQSFLTNNDNFFSPGEESITCTKFLNFHISAYHFERSMHVIVQQFLNLYLQVVERQGPSNLIQRIPDCWYLPFLPFPIWKPATTSANLEIFPKSIQKISWIGKLQLQLPERRQCSRCQGRFRRFQRDHSRGHKGICFFNHGKDRKWTSVPAGVNAKDGQ